ncbi:MAG: GGDEF domain-containing protein [Terracidiphilus sp.]
MSAESTVAALLGAFSLDFSTPYRSERMRRIGLLLAAALSLLCAAILAEYLLHLSFGIDVAFPSGMESSLSFVARIPVQSAAGFGLLGLVLMFLGARKRVAALAADLLTGGLFVLAMTLLTGQVTDMLHIFGPLSGARSSAQSIVCLFLLTAVAFFRRARRGIFSVLLGRGTGSNLARVLSPFLLLLPYVREGLRAHILNWRRMPPYYATASLASVAMVLSMAMLLYLAWRINGMETEIHALSLRDELTGLYNLRGFRLLAEQALRMAHRSGDPFSVLFIDLDDLKQINDQLGHQAGSDCLIETAEILKAVFRESDVVGRVGGDEFAVAGEFTRSGILVAAQRMEELATDREAISGHELGLAFSIGHVTSESVAGETLDTLLSKADRAMYENKRRRKALAN